MKQNTLILFLWISLFSLAKAQTPVHTPETTKIPSSVRFGLQYKSDYYYMGRADSAKAPYLTPSVAYFHKSGLFVSGQLSYLTAQDQKRIDLVSLSTGYDYYNEKIATGISVNQYFFNDLSYSVQAEMSTYVSAYFGYDFRLFMLAADASMGVSSSLDFFLGGEISHSFYFLKDNFRITPSLYANMGTQHYYKEYYSERSLTTGDGKTGSGNNAGSGGGSGSGGNGSGGQGSNSGGGSNIMVAEITTSESEKFQLLDYELGLQLSYRIKQFRFLVMGTVLVPLNPSTIVTDQSTYEEELSTGFLWSAGIRYTIR